MPTIKLHQDIKCKPEELSRVVADIENYPKWNPMAGETKKVSGGSGAGAKFQMQAKGVGRMELEILEHEPGKRFKLVSRAGMADMTLLMELSSSGDKTAVDHTATGKAKGLAILMLPFMGWMMRKNMRKWNGALQKHLEGGGR
jgi:hypothetical protein